MVRLLLVFLACTALNMDALGQDTPPLSTAQQLRVRWVAGGGDDLTHVGEYVIAEYKNAGEGGIDWTLEGPGYDGGNGTSQLWLLTGPKTASVRFTVPSEAVAFMMVGDHNDGFATLLVDGQEIGTFDLYRRGRQTIVVDQLPYAQHRLTVRYTGQKQARSPGAHVALHGGAALLREHTAHAGSPR